MEKSMQVQKTQGRVNFGYNQQLNKILVSKCEKAKKNKEFWDTLLKFNNFTNETEMLLREVPISTLWKSPSFSQ